MSCKRRQLRFVKDTAGVQIQIDQRQVIVSCLCVTDTIVLEPSPADFCLQTVVMDVALVAGVWLGLLVRLMTFLFKLMVSRLGSRSYIYPTCCCAPNRLLHAPYQADLNYMQFLLKQTFLVLSAIRASTRIITKVSCASAYCRHCPASRPHGTF